MQGFTLVELMITIVIMALLLLVAMPFTGAWIDGTRQMRAKSNLIEAVGRARALAMRNPSALPNSSTGIAAVVYDSASHALCVIKRDAAGSWEADACLAEGRSCSDGGTDEASRKAEGVDWLGCIANPGDLSIKAAGVDFGCVAYDGHGIQQEVAAGDGPMAAGCLARSARTVSVLVGSQEGLDVALF